MAQTYKDYLHIVSDKSIAGQNKIDWRATWIGLDNIEQIATAQIPGDIVVRGEWVAEGGDATLPPQDREPRILAKKGKLRVVFTGTNISIRVGVNPGWGIGQVWLDGKRPSQIPGLSVFLDNVSCDSDVYGSYGNEYIDVTIADNLTDVEHVLEIYCNNPGEGVGGFFVVTGFKVFSDKNRTRSRDAWIEPRVDLPQPEVMKIRNYSARDVSNVSLEFPNGLVDVNGNPLGHVFLGVVPADSSKDITVLPNLDGHEREGKGSYPIVMRADYEVDTGQSSGLLIPLGVGITYTGGWADDINNGEHRQFSTKKGASMEFTVNNNKFTIRMQKDFGWGSFLVLIKPFAITGCGVTSGSPIVKIPSGLDKIQVGMYITGTNIPTVARVVALDTAAGTVTISANATGTNANRTLTFETYLTEVSSDSLEGGGYYENTEVANLPEPFGNRVRLVAKNANPAVWSKITWPGSNIYTHSTETLFYEIKRKHVPPFPVKKLELKEGAVEYTPVIPDAKDLTIPYDNRDLVREEIVTRFPTFLVIYQPGYQEIIKQYDIAVLDPFALTRKQVKELQALGIKVIVYVSFGEEDGTLLNKWNPNSDQVPWVGDGQGPGGYASYYMKGGYGYGEMSECEFDRQRLDGVKACAKTNPNYNPEWSGRCTAACSKDWREGYIEWEKGNACGGGYTNTTFWQRDASTACTNRGCPKYTPANNKCSEYQKANAWGQDYSLMADYPDENGIWTSYYVDAVDRGPNSWFARIRDYYLPLIFDEPTPREEILTVAQHESDPGVYVLGIELGFAPLDEDEPLRMIDVATGHEYQKGVEWSMDSKLGTITLAATEGSPKITVGQQIKAIYSTKGLGADGVFMDTVDTVDVYPREDYQDGAADLINQMKLMYPNKAFCSNRGFSILDKIIHSCSYVMFETFLSEYDWEKKVYYKIGQASSDWNDQITSQLFRLRRKHVFDVIGLNYCSNGPEGDELRKYIREETTKRGWMSWSSEILLNRPLPNQPYTDQKGPLRTNIWRAYKHNRPTEALPPADNLKIGALGTSSPDGSSFAKLVGKQPDFSNELTAEQAGQNIVALYYTKADVPIATTNSYDPAIGNTAAAQILIVWDSNKTALENDQEVWELRITPAWPPNHAGIEPQVQKLPWSNLSSVLGVYFPNNSFEQLGITQGSVGLSVYLPGEYQKGHTFELVNSAGDTIPITFDPTPVGGAAAKYYVDVPNFAVIPDGEVISESADRANRLYAVSGDFFTLTPGGDVNSNANYECTFSVYYAQDMESNWYADLSGGSDGPAVWAEQNNPEALKDDFIAKYGQSVYDTVMPSNVKAVMIGFEGSEDTSYTFISEDVGLEFQIDFVMPT